MSSASTLVLMFAGLIGVVAIAGIAYWVIASRARRERQGRVHATTERAALQNR